MHILIADDDPVSRRLLEATLLRLGHTVVAVADGHTANERLLAPDAPRMAILDWMMPGIDGLGVCDAVRRNAVNYVYIILLTAKDRREDMVAALDGGVDDFLTKPLDQTELRVRLRSGERVLELEERLLRSQEALRHQAQHDHLTGLWNRGRIFDELSAQLKRAVRERRPVAVALGDLDHFKQVNDTLGHATGDLVLESAAKSLQSALRSYDTVGRIGGEEFLLLLPGCELPEAMDIAERARAAVAATPVAGPAGPIQATMSLGVACHRPGETASGVALVEAADLALYRAKAGGRNRVAH